MAVQPGYVYGAVDFAGLDTGSGSMRGNTFTSADFSSLYAAPTQNGQWRVDMLSVGQTQDSSPIHTRTDKRRSMQLVKKSTAVNVRFYMRTTADGQGFASLATAAIVVSICKSTDVTFGTITPTLTNLGNGWFNAALTTSHTDTTGITPLRFTAPNAVPNDETVIEVTGFDPFDGDALGLAMMTFPKGLVVGDGSNTTTSFKTNFTSATNDTYKDGYLVFYVSSTLATQVKKVTGYNGTTKFITVAGGFTGIPADGDAFYFVNK